MLLNKGRSGEQTDDTGVHRRDGLSSDININTCDLTEMNIFDDT